MLFSRSFCSACGERAGEQTGGRAGGQAGGRVGGEWGAGDGGRARDAHVFAIACVRACVGEAAMMLRICTKQKYVCGSIAISDTHAHCPLPGTLHRGVSQSGLQPPYVVDGEICSFGGV